MHGITRCPSCDTAFNVAHKQLARAKGKADKLAAQRQSQFYVDIDQRSEDIQRFSLALCCQQK